MSQGTSTGLVLKQTAAHSAPLKKIHPFLSITDTHSKLELITFSAADKK